VDLKLAERMIREVVGTKRGILDLLFIGRIHVLRKKMHH
jgi:hypothetical protein